MRFIAPLPATTPRRRGLTLIELLVVIAIILILSALSVFIFSAAKNTGENLQAKAREAVAKVKPRPETWPPIPRTLPAAKETAREPERRMPRYEPPTERKTEPKKKDVVAHLGRMPQAPDFNCTVGHCLPEPDALPIRVADRRSGRVDRPVRRPLVSARLTLTPFEPRRPLSMPDFPRLGRLTLAYLGARLPGAEASDAGEPYGLDDPAEFCAAPAGNSLIWDPYPTTSAFLLHSNPGAKCVIYMDFNGHTTGAGNPWNTLVNGGNPITTLAFSMDGDRTTFNATELAKIIDMWRSVAEDFIPFDVDVTTEDPGAAVMSSPGTMRAVIGPVPTVSNPTPWAGAGGIAYIGSFNSGGDVVCWNWNGDSTANPETSLPCTVSHEIGHTLGLNHDADPPAGYYGGHGAGVTSWGPLMGAPFNRNLTQWSRNTYPNANNAEDDLDIIGTKNGFGFRPDDHGNTTTSATALNAIAQGALKTTYGVVENETDVDVFGFFADPGPIKIQIDPLFFQPNLDIQAELYNFAGTLLMTSNVTTKLDATFVTNLVDKGAFFIKIKGAALLPVLPAGYPTYGSIGSYRIAGDVTPLTPAFDSFKTLNPLRWDYDPAARTYEGNITIANIKDSPITGRFTIVLTLPHPSIQVVSPAGTVNGQTYLIPFDGTITPGVPLRLPIRLTNPMRIPLLTGSNSYVTDIQTSFN